MNSNINVGNLGSSFGVLAAGLIFAYGVWVGRGGLGMRAAWGVLGSVILTSSLSFLALFALPLILGGGLRAGLGTVLLTGVGTLLSFLPLYIAVNWMEVIRDASRPRS